MKKKSNTKIYHRFSGYTLEDCDCRYCLHYGGGRKGCLADKCVCIEEIEEARRTERSRYGSKN